MILLSEAMKQEFLNETPLFVSYAMSVTDATTIEQFNNSTKTDVKPFKGYLSNNHILMLRTDSLSMGRYKSIAIYTQNNNYILVNELQLYNLVENNLYIDLSNLDKPKGVRVDSTEITHTHLLAENLMMKLNDESGDMETDKERIEATTPPSSKYVAEEFKKRTIDLVVDQSNIYKPDVNGEFWRYDKLKDTEKYLYSELKDFLPLQCRNYHSNNSALLLVGELENLGDFIRYDAILWYDLDSDKIYSNPFFEPWVSFYNGKITCSKEIPELDLLLEENKGIYLYTDENNYAYKNEKNPNES